MTDRQMVMDMMEDGDRENGQTVMYRKQSHTVWMSCYSEDEESILIYKRCWSIRILQDWIYIYVFVS